MLIQIVSSFSMISLAYESMGLPPEKRYIVMWLYAPVPESDDREN